MAPMKSTSLVFQSYYFIFKLSHNDDFGMFECG